VYLELGTPTQPVEITPANAYVVFACSDDCWPDPITIEMLAADTPAPRRELQMAPLLKLHGAYRSPVWKRDWG
jgi:hypothetical protein